MFSELLCYSLAASQYLEGAPVILSQDFHPAAALKAPKQVCRVQRNEFYFPPVAAGTWAWEKAIENK